MFAGLFSLLLNAVAIYKWRCRTEAVRITIQTSKDLHEARLTLYALETKAVDGDMLTLARMRVVELQQQREDVTKAALAYDAIHVQPAPKPDDKK